MAHCFCEWHVLYRGELLRATTCRVHEDLLQEFLGSPVPQLHLTPRVFDVAHYEREHAIQCVGVAQFLDCDESSRFTGIKKKKQKDVTGHKSDETSKKRLLSGRLVLVL